MIQSSYLLQKLRGLALLEVIVAVVIMVVLAVPVFQVFSQSNRIFQMGKAKSLANLLAHKVVEDLMALSYHGELSKIPQHSDYRAVVQGSGLALSPYFTNMDGQVDGLSASDYPNLIRELKDFRCRVFLHEALDLKDSKNFQTAKVEIKYPREDGQENVVVMQVILSTLAQVR